MLTDPPVRLCCFQRHYGVQCPDGTFMCCSCFGKFPVAEATDGYDVCQRCSSQVRGWVIDE